MIKEIDAASGANHLIEIQMSELQNQLAAIRQELEALPDKE